MTLTVDMSDPRRDLLQAKAEGRYCSGCALDRFLWAAEQAPVPRSLRTKFAEQWLSEFENLFAPEDSSQLAKDGTCRICRKPKVSELRRRRALSLS
jgi:hypothetical protein